MGGGVNEKRAGVYKGGEGVRNWQFYCVRTLWMPHYNTNLTQELVIDELEITSSILFKWFNNTVKLYESKQ